LCFTLPADLPGPRGCTHIGEVTAGAGVACDLDVDKATGYRHF